MLPSRCVQRARGGLRLTKVRRIVVADGDFYEVACAVVADGVSSPAATLLEELKEGMWADPQADVLPDEYQPRLRTRLLAHITELAKTGDLPPRAYNRLEDGVWEIKVEGIRLTFYDTDGAGGWVPKQGETVPTWDGRQRHELPDDFDQYVRLGHHFPKKGQKAARADIDRSIEVRTEDVSHDAGD